MTRTILVFLLIIFVSLVKGQVQNSWTQKMDFGGLKRDRAVAFSIEGYGYVATGEDTANITHKDLWQYDPEVDAWTQKADLPASPRRNAIAFSIGSKGYLGTGIDSSEAFVGTILNDFWEYNPVTNSWIEKAPYPGGGGSGVYFAAAFTADNKGYITCGKAGPNNYKFDLWEYKPTTDSWSQRANFPGGVRYALSAMSIDNKGYVGFGVDNDVYRKDWWQYNPATNTWLQKSNFPGSERGSASTFTIGSKGFLVFGADGGFKDELWEYNPYSDSWNIKSNFPGEERRNGIAFAIGEKGYAGLGKGPNGRKKNFYEYHPAYPLGIDKYDLLTIQVYPNPINESAYLFLQNESNADYYVIIDLTGKIVQVEKIQDRSVQISRSSEASGIYQLVVFNEQNVPLASEKIIFQ